MQKDWFLFYPLKHIFFQPSIFYENSYTGAFEVAVNELTIRYSKWRIQWGGQKCIEKIISLENSISIRVFEFADCEYLIRFLKFRMTDLIWGTKFAERGEGAVQSSRSCYFKEKKVQAYQTSHFSYCSSLKNSGKLAKLHKF